MTETPQPEPLLSVRELQVSFDVDGEEVVSVESSSFDVGHNEVVAIVGESGSGKSVTAMSILGLHPKNATMTGSIRFDGRELLNLSSSELRSIRGAESRRGVRIRLPTSILTHPDNR